MKVSEAVERNPAGPTFICDFSPPRSGTPDALADASKLQADFICVAYNPGKAVRVDSSAAAFEIKRATGRDAVFNLSPRDMNKLAIETRLLGAQVLGLENVLVIQGDPIVERDATTSVADFTATGLIAAISQLNQGIDYKGGKLRSPTDFCIGSAIDLGKGIESEAALAHRKAEAGAHFFVTQPVWSADRIEAFAQAYEAVAGGPLTRPVFWGLQVLVADGVIFSSVPEAVRVRLSEGRDAVEIALETYAALRDAGIGSFYLVPPIQRGGARDYDAAARFLTAVGR